MTGARLRRGLALALVYVALAAAYNARPLFDGFAPPAPYRWVSPPPEFRAGNVVPQPATVEAPLGPSGSAQAGGSSGDGQVILSFAAGAFPAQPPDTKVVVQVAPVDPATLAPPPAGLAADGNAYRLQFAYEPSKSPAAAVAAPADIFLVVPEPAQSLLFSADGQAWEVLPFRPVPDLHQIGGAFDRPGYFLAVAPPVDRLRPGGGGEAAGVLRAVAAIAALALALWFLPVGARRLRGRGA